MLQDKDRKIYEYSKIIPTWKDSDIHKIEDTILDSIEKQKNYKPIEEVDGLKVSSIDAHSMKITRHNHLYLPYDMRRAVSSMLTPYNIPVLRHHSSFDDAIGRVVDASYVPTKNGFDSAMYAKLDTITVDDKKFVKTLRKIKDVLYSPDNTGMGHAVDTSNITDEDAITKILNHTYDSVSMGYGFNRLVCSECGKDIFECEHMPGKDYGHGKVFIVFDGLEYLEKSYVNEPADPLAGNSAFAKLYNKDNANNDNVSKDALCAGSCSVNLIGYDSLTTNKNNNKSEANMTYNEFIKLGDSLYEKVIALLPKDSQVTLDTIKELEDDDFVGSNRLLPANSLEMIDASTKVLEELEDSDEKNEFIDFLNTRIELLKNNDKEPDDTGADTTGTDEPDNESIVEKTEDGILLKENTIKSEDAINVALDMVKVSLGGEASLTDAVSKILETVEDKDSVLTPFLEEKINTLESRVDSYKHELAVQKTNFEAISNTAKELTNELKDMYIEKLMSFRVKEDPSLDADSLKEQFKKRSLDSLKSTYEDMSLLVGNEDNNQSTNTDTTDVEKLDNSNEDTVEYTNHDIELMEDKYFKNYKEILAINPTKAKEYRDNYTQKLETLKKQINK